MDFAVKDLGSDVSVTVSADAVRAFKSRWPASGLPNRAITFRFQKSNADLVDIHPSVDGEAAAALSQDAWQAYMSRHTFKRGQIVNTAFGRAKVIRALGPTWEDDILVEYGNKKRTQIRALELNDPNIKQAGVVPYESKYRGGSMAAAKTAFKQPKDAIKLTIYELQKKLELPEYDDLYERNVDYISEAGSGWAAEKREELAEDEDISEEAREEEIEMAQQKGEQEAEKELFSNWYGAVEHAAEEIWGFHGLDIRTGHAGTAFIVTPKVGKTWHDVARQIAITINGVGMVEVSAEEYARSPRKWVLEHLGAMKYQPDVYGTASATRIYENSFR